MIAASKASLAISPDVARRFLVRRHLLDTLWEVYTPEAKRKHGYYVLPILFGDRLVGRIEPRRIKGSTALQIVAIWFEAGFAPLTEPGFVEGFAAALHAYARFVGAQTIAWPRTKIVGALRKAMQPAAP